MIEVDLMFWWFGSNLPALHSPTLTYAIWAQAELRDGEVSTKNGTVPCSKPKSLDVEQLPQGRVLDQEN